jgi:hypothetical protein
MVLPIKPRSSTSRSSGAVAATKKNKGSGSFDPACKMNLTPLLQNRDYPVLTNYRDMLGGVFSRVWGLSAGQLQTVFPGSHPRDLQLV